MNAEQISTLFAADVAVSIATSEMYDAPLFAEEYAAVCRSVLVRQREFAAGRATARLALAKLGLPATPIPTGADRLPKWPTGYVGSISHCSGFCCSVAAPTDQARSLGIDVENATPLSPDLYPLVFDEEEILHLEKVRVPRTFDLYKVGFCAKEAFYKCYYPLTEHFLDFRDVSLRLADSEDQNSGQFFVKIKDVGGVCSVIDRDIIGRWKVAGQYVFTGATLI